MTRRRPTSLLRFAAVAGAALAIFASSAAACPFDPPRGDVPVDARNNICGTWDYAASHGFSPGTALNETHPWAEGYVRDFSSGYYGRGGIMERHGEGWAFIVGGGYWDALLRAGGAPKIGYPDGPHVFGGHLNPGPRSNTYMTFTKGVINSSAHGTFASYGAIRARWNAMGNVSGPLGLPLSDEADTARVPGRYQEFEGGNLIWDPATGLTWHVYGGILNKYAQLGYSNHPLGLPAGDRQHNAPKGNEYQVFQGGVINQYEGNAYETHGAILDKWNALGGANGPVGLPISDEAPTARVAGRFSRFQGGNIYYNQRLNSTLHIYGGILNKYLSLGYSNHPLGLPTSDRQINPVRGNEYQTFDGGVINQYGGNAYETHGAILDRWNQEGGANGWLGLPTTDEHPTAVSPGARVGRYSRFQNGIINYNPYLNRTFVLAHDIGRKYASLGFAASYLGLPTSDELNDGGGARKQLFEGGWIRWTPDGGSITNLEQIEDVQDQLAVNSFEDDAPPAPDPLPGVDDPTPPPPPPPPPPVDSYVALGDSVAAGEGLNYDWEWRPGGSGSGRWERADTRSPPWNVPRPECHRASGAYPVLVKRMLGISDEGFLHQACTGAAAENGILTTQRVLPNGPVVNPDPQLGTDAADHGPPSASYDQIRPRIVSLTVGANDIEFADRLASCFMSFFGDCHTPTLQNQVSKDLGDQRKALRRTLEEIVSRARNLGAPLPLVLLTTYFDPFPRTYPESPGDCRDLSVLRLGIGSFTLLSAEEVRYLRASLDRLNRNIRDVASEFPNTRVVEAPGEFSQHPFCSHDPWVYGPSIRLADASSIENPAPFHPTHEGQEAIADAMARILRGTRPVSAGNNVTRQFADGVSLNFSEVDEGGTVSVTSSSEPPPGGAPNSSFSAPTFFEMSSSAAVDGELEFSVPAEAGQQLYRYRAGEWTAVPGTERTGEELTATVPDLAPLALGAPVPALSAAFTHTPGGISPIGADFDASGSSAAGGEIASYTWFFGDGSTGEGATTSHAYESAGVYRVRLRVDSAAGAVDEASAEIEVTNLPPRAGMSPATAAVAGQPLAISGGLSHDPNGSITGWAWDFGDGGTGFGATTDHTYASPGTYEITMTAIDDEGAQDVAHGTITVAAPGSSLPLADLPLPVQVTVPRPAAPGAGKQPRKHMRCKKKKGKQRRGCTRRRGHRSSP